MSAAGPPPDTSSGGRPAYDPWERQQELILRLTEKSAATAERAAQSYEDTVKVLGGVLGQVSALIEAVTGSVQTLESALIHTKERAEAATQAALQDQEIKRLREDLRQAIQDRKALQATLEEHGRKLEGLMVRVAIGSAGAAAVVAAVVGLLFKLLGG